QGSAIQVSLFEAMCDWMAVPLLHYDYAGTIWPRVGLSHPTIAPYGAFPVGTALGEAQLLLLGVQNNGEWQRLASQVLDAPELLERAEFSTNQRRVENRRALDALITERFAHFSLADLRDRLKRAGVAYATVNDVTGLSRHPHLRRVAV